MAQVKKAFVEIIEFLEENAEKKVKTILEEAIELCSAKTRAGAGGSKTFLKDTDGIVVAIFDYYFKKWMPLVGKDAVDYGSKVGTASGFNTMCKEGVSNWTKQQRIAKTATAAMVDDLESGALAPTDIADKRAEIDAARSEIIETDLATFDSIEEVTEYLASEGFTVAASDED